MLNNESYRMSFTTGGLFRNESVKLTNLYRELGDWDAVREQALRDNLLQARTMSSAKRTGREVLSRLQTLRPEELHRLVDADYPEQGYILWLAVCRRYPFIGDFAVEVLRERFVTLKQDLQQADFEEFYNRKSEWHPELDAIRPATRAKLRQVLFRMLREADLLATDNTINAVMPGSPILETLVRGDRCDVRFFPLMEADSRRLTA